MLKCYYRLPLQQRCGPREREWTPMQGTPEMARGALDLPLWGPQRSEEEATCVFRQ